MEFNKIAIDNKILWATEQCVQLEKTWKEFCAAKFFDYEMVGTSLATQEFRVTQVNPVPLQIGFAIGRSAQPIQIGSGLFDL